MKSESEVAQSCPTPSDPMDCSLPGSSVHGIFQARVLEWGAIAFSDKCIVTTNNINCSERKLRYMVKGWGWNVLDQISWKHSGWWLHREDPLWSALRTLVETLMKQDWVEGEVGPQWGCTWALSGPYGGLAAGTVLQSYPKLREGNKALHLHGHWLQTASLEEFITEGKVLPVATEEIHSERSISELLAVCFSKSWGWCISPKAGIWGNHHVIIIVYYQVVWACLMGQSAKSLPAV